MRYKDAIIAEAANISVAQNVVGWAEHAPIIKWFNIIVIPLSLLVNVL
jgi:hypothetical protein